jgi:hypothetical protein
MKMTKRSAITDPFAEKLKSGSVEVLYSLSMLIEQGQSICPALARGEKGQ